MKKALLCTALTLTLAFASGAGAQTAGSGSGMKHDNAQQRQTASPGQNMPEIMYSGSEMGPEMMDGADGYGRYMRGSCNGFGYGFGRNFADREKLWKFLDATSNLRKTLLLLTFDYREKLRNPATTMQDLFDMERDMVELQRQIREKAAEYSLDDYNRHGRKHRGRR